MLYVYIYLFGLTVLSVALYANTSARYPMDPTGHNFAAAFLGALVWPILLPARIVQKVLR